MSFPSRSRIAFPDYVLVREIDDELVLLNLETEQYFGLDETSKFFWQALNGSPTVEDAVGHLLEEFDVDEQTLRQDLEDFIDDLSKRGLVETPVA